MAKKKRTTGKKAKRRPVKKKARKSKRRPKKKATARRPKKKATPRKARKKVRKIKAKKVGSEPKPIAERIISTEGRLRHEREFIRKGRFKKGAMVTRQGEKHDFLTSHPPGRPDVNLTVGCLVKDYDRKTGLCMRTTVQKTSRRITKSEAKRLQARNPMLLVVSNPVSGTALMPEGIRGKKLVKGYKRFHMSEPAEVLEMWRPNGWPQGYISIGECEMFRVKDKNGKMVTRRFKTGHRPYACMTAAGKDVYILPKANDNILMKKGLGIPSGEAVRIDYMVPKHSGRVPWSRRWFHDHDTRPRVTVHKSGKAVRISGPGLKVTPRGIIG